MFGTLAAVRKQLGSRGAAAVITRELEERSVYRYPVTLLAVDLGKASRLREILVGRGFKDVRLAEPAGYRHVAGSALVLVCEDGLDPKAVAASAGAGEGLLYTTGFVAKELQPAGDWTMANSRIALHANLRVLVEWLRQEA